MKSASRASTWSLRTGFGRFASRQSFRKRSFELGFREGASGVMVGQGFQQLACSAMAGVRSGQGIEGNVVAEPCALRSMQQPLDAAAIQGGGEVEDGASRGGDGDAVGHTVLGSRGHWVAAVPA